MNDQGTLGTGNHHMTVLMAWCKHLVDVNIGQHMFPCVTWRQDLKLKGLRDNQENTVKALLTDTHESGELC